MFDEIDRVHYRTLELIRDLHDQTKCPVLLCGKPQIYEKLGFRHVGDFSVVTDLKLHVSPDALKWMRSRASTLGTGGIGIAMGCLYLAYKLAVVQNANAVTADHLGDVADLTIGHEDAQRVAEVVAESAGIKRAV